MSARFLMCRPDYYGVHYEINPWMHCDVKVDALGAMKQWEALVAIMEDDLKVKVELIPALDDLADMVFTANAGYVEGKRFIPSRFRYPQRQGEEPHYRKWFADRNYEIIDIDENCYFEGCGDALPIGDLIFAGYRFRSHIGSHKELGKILNKKVISLELIQDWFYHLDTCFCPLENGDLIYYPGAFDDYAVTSIESHLDEEKLIRVSDDEARTFCCNAVSIGDSVIMNSGAPMLVAELEKRGLKVFQTELSEFIKSGGSAKCLTLRLE